VQIISEVLPLDDFLVCASSFLPQPEMINIRVATTGIIELDLFIII